MATNTDSFTYSTGDLATVSGGLWVKLRTGGQNIDVKATGDITGVGTTDAPYYYNATYASAAVFSEIKYKTLAGSAEFAVIINCATATDGARSYYIFEITESGGTYNLLRGKIIAGTFTSLATKTGVTVSANDVFRMANDGSGNLSEYINGVLVTGWTVAVAGPYTELTHARVGIMPSSVGSERLDDWQGGDVTIAGRTTKNTRAYPLGVAIGMGIGMPGMSSRRREAFARRGSGVWVPERMAA